MTDIRNWEDTIHIMKIPYVSPWDGKRQGFSEYLMVPLNEYQMGNLIDAISQAIPNGDWHGEFCNIVVAAMEFLGIGELRSNRGHVYTLGDIKQRQLEK